MLLALNLGVEDGDQGAAGERGRVAVGLFIITNE